MVIEERREWFLSVPEERRLFVIEAYRAELATYTNPDVHSDRQAYLTESIETFEEVMKS